jgi:hypothetical protein
VLAPSHTTQLPENVHWARIKEISPTSRVMHIGIREVEMSEGKKEGKNVVRKRLQPRRKKPTAKQSQAGTEEIATQDLGAASVVHEEYLRGLGKDSAVKSGCEEQIAMTGKRCRSRNDRY